VRMTMMTNSIDELFTAARIWFVPATAKIVQIGNC
jgi:hypothetical protein